MRLVSTEDQGQTLRSYWLYGRPALRIVAWKRLCSETATDVYALHRDACATEGSCKVITREIPYKATYTGAACFNWSKRFKVLPNGYYEGDIYINGKSCVSWPFHIQDCYYEVGTESVTDLQDDCHAVECTTACGRCHQTACQCSKPPLEVEIETVRADCGGCEQC